MHMTCGREATDVFEIQSSWLSHGPSDELFASIVWDELSGFRPESRLHGRLTWNMLTTDPPAAAVMKKRPSLVIATPAAGPGCATTPLQEARDIRGGHSISPTVDSVEANAR